MPGSPETSTQTDKIEQGHQTPAAGKKGGKPQTEEEKKKVSLKERMADFFRNFFNKKDVLDEANEKQRAEVKQFEERRKKKPIEDMTKQDLEEELDWIIPLSEELISGDPELQEKVRQIENMLLFEADRKGVDTVAEYAKYYKSPPQIIGRSFVEVGTIGAASEGYESQLQALQEKINEKPIESWNTEELKEAIKMVSTILDKSYQARKGLMEGEELEKLWDIASRVAKYEDALREQIARKGVDLEDLDEEIRLERMKQEEKESSYASGTVGAAEIPVDGGWSVPLRGEMDALNVALDALDEGEVREQLEELRQAQRAISRMGGITNAERTEATRRIRSRITELQGSGEPNLTPEDVDNPEDTERFVAANYVTAPLEIRNIANELRATVDGARTDAAGNVIRPTNEYLRVKLVELTEILGRPALDSDTEQHGYRLQKDMRHLKNVLSAKEATRAQESSRSLYAEIRMTEPEKRYVIDLAIRANPDPRDSAGWEAWRLLEEEFNRRFARADVNSSDDWRDALGPGGSTEISEFISTLTNAGENRTRLLGHLLSPDQQTRVREAVRRLKQEEKVREYLHTISYMVNSNAGAEDIIKAATRFPGEEAQVAFRRRGVGQMMRIYEQAMLEIMAKNGGYLPAKAMINTSDGQYGEVEKLVWEQSQRARDMGVLPKGMPDWEIRRAIALARGMGIVTARFFEISALHGIQKNIPLNSFWANGLVKNIAFFQQVARFNIGQNQNAILGYKLERNRSPWSTDELKRFKAMSTKELFDTLVNDRDDDRLIHMKNPFHIGSIFTQTGWRWRGDKVNLASATARLLEHDENNPLIGVGLFIEARRGDLTDHSNRAKSRKAEQEIHHAIELAAETTPLKLFNNLISLRQDVLRKHYKNNIKEDSDYPGQIIITDENLKDDIAALALVQENLLQERVRRYERFLEEKRTNPDLALPTLPTHLNFNALVTSTDVGERGRQEAQARRVSELAKHIKDEFKEKGIFGQSHFDKLMYNLHNKGWKVPFVFGADDIPHEAFDYEAITGDTIKRRWDADIGPVVATAGLYSEFISNLTEFQSSHDIVKAMKKIHSTLSGHDASVANDVMRYLAEGVGKFYKKDWTGRLPFGVGTINNFVGGQASYAQVAFGRGQMAWDELDLQAFLHEVLASGLVDHDQYEELKKRLGADWFNLSWAMGRSGFSLLIAAFIYMMINEQLEQLKKSA